MNKINYTNESKTFEEKLNNSQNTYEDQDYNTKNKNFIQYYDNSFPYRSQLIEESPTAFRVFDLLAKNMENNNTIATSKEEIAEAIGKSKETIKRAIKLLKEYNFLTIIRFGKEYIYFLNPVIVFNRAGKYKHTAIKNYCEYSETGDTKIMMKLETIEQITNFKNRERVAYKFKLKFEEFNEDEATATKKYLDRLDKIEIIDTTSQEIVDDCFETTDFTDL